MKRVKYILMVLLAATISSCNYLDVVPDGVVEISSKFTTQAGVRQALGKCYEYMPDFAYVHGSVTLAGDEYCCPNVNATFTTGGSCRGLWLVRGLQTATNVSLSFWDGNRGGQNLYEGIRYCNVFLENIHNCVGVPQKMINDWIAQVKVLRAYYHYFLIQCYGPILIYDKVIDLSSDVEDMRAKRETLEYCFDWVVKELDAALAVKDFEESRRNNITENLLLDKVITKAIKAKVLLLKASPIFNGNNMYADFRDNDGVLLIDADHYEGEEIWMKRWTDAQAAIKEAIDYAENEGRRELYDCAKDESYKANDYDAEYWDVSEIIKYCYSLRYTIVDPNASTNKELIWGNGLGRNFSGSYTMQTATQIRTGELTDPSGNYYNDDGNTESGCSFGWLGASMEAAEMFYTKNGLPIDVDPSFDYAGRYSLAKVPSDNYHLSYMAQNEQTAKLHLNREPRFYAWILVDRGCYRDYNRLIPLTSMLYGDTQGPGGGTAIKGSSEYDLIQSGLGIKKFVNPASKNRYTANVVMYPFPMIRLADLYLMYAEACANVGDCEIAVEYLDKIRERAGIPSVAESWVAIAGKNASDKKDVLDMVKWERRVELSFEGHRYFDVVRWLEGNKYFNSPIRGWNYTGARANNFYQVVNLFQKQWSNKNYLWPLPSSELDKNPRLVQNPWW